MKAARIEQQQTKHQPGEQHWYYNCHPELDVKVLYTAVSCSISQSNEWALAIVGTSTRRAVNGRYIYAVNGRYIYKAGSEWSVHLRSEWLVHLQGGQ